LVNKDEDSDTEPREIMSEPSDREDGESTETQRVDKRAFIRQLAKEADIPLCAAAQAYEAFIKVLFDNVRAGNQVNLTGFGKFYWQRHSGHKVQFGAGEKPDYTAAASLSSNPSTGRARRLSRLTCSSW